MSLTLHADALSINEGSSGDCYGDYVIKCEAKNTEKEQSRNIIQYIRNVSEKVQNASKRVQQKREIS
jgi:hypothetical protein